MNNIVSVSGFGWSGSGAVFDLLREYSDIDILDKRGKDFEFTLLDEKDGISDLDFGLNVNNSRLISSLYISRFLDLIDYMSKKRGFEVVFNGHFKEISQKYIDDLVDYSFEAWTFEDVRNPLKKNRKKDSYNRIVKHVFDNRITTHCPLSVRIGKRLMMKVTHPIRVSYYPTDFIEKTKHYFNSLFEICHPHAEYPLVIDHLFSPEKPEKSFKYFNNSKCIVVRRDPRDTYLLAKCAISHIAVPLPVENVDDYITFYREVIANSRHEESESILPINFEDLIYNYEETVGRIEKFIGISDHFSPRKFFNPDISINNTQLFRKYTYYSSEIEKITKELATSLYPFEKYQFKRTSSNVF